MKAAEPHPAGPQRTLSDAELELVIDGATAADRAESVERTLESAGADAARLEELRAIDALVRGALLAPIAGSSRTGRRRRAAPLLAAAALLLVAGAAALIRLQTSAPEPPKAPPPVVAVRPVADAAEYESVRVVLSLPAPRSERSPTDVPASAADTTETTRPSVSQAREIASAFGDASDAGIRRAVTAINEASPEDRAAALATLGQTLRSGSTAVRILDKLGPRDQVAVCSELALDASLRAVALQRLRGLADDPDVGADARAAVRALAAAPGMKPWLRSYGLLEDPPKPTSLERSSLSPAMG